MAWYCDRDVIRTVRIFLLLIHLCSVPTVIYCGDAEIPGPHFPEFAGAPGDEIVNTGNVPAFSSYLATDQHGKEHVYVPVYVALYTDAGESSFKDVRQNFDKSITIHGDNDFWCAFGHPYRQFAFHDKYKWDIFRKGLDSIDSRIPPQPLIRSFLVEVNAMKDIMLKATTEPFNKIAGDHDYNVDKSATNQFGIVDKSKTMLEMAALPGSLVTYVEDQKGLHKYAEVTNTWGQIKNLAELKQQFNVPTEIFSSPKSSIFTTGDKINLANYEDVIANIKRKEENGENVNEKWKEFASVLKEMENLPKSTDANKLTMLKLQAKQIRDYPVPDFANTKTVQNYIEKQNIHFQYTTDVSRLLDSYEVLKVATTTPKLSWSSIVSQQSAKNNMLRLKDRFTTECVSFMAGKQDFKSMNDLKMKMELNNIQWLYAPSLDNYKENIKSALSFLKNNGLLTDFPGVDMFTKTNLMDYYRNSLINYIQSDTCKLNNDHKNIIVQNINGIAMQTKRNIVYTNAENVGSKISLGTDESKNQILMPDDRLSVELMGKDFSGDQIQNALVKVVDSTKYISPPDKVTLLFPDIDLNTETELLWKRHATEIGDYLRSTMKVKNIELTFKGLKSLKYDMVSHTINNGQVKEWPLRIVDGHLVIDNYIAPPNVIRKMKETYNSIVGEENSLSQLVASKKSDIVFVPNDKGFFLTNKVDRDVLKSVEIDDYKNKNFKKPIRNEIIVALKPSNLDILPDVQRPEQVLTAVDEATNMLSEGYRQKNKVHVLTVSASKENNVWNLNTNFDSGTLDDVRITIVGKGYSSSQSDIWTIGGQDSQGINELIQKIKTKFDINGDDIQKVSVVACNPKTTTVKSKDTVNRAKKLAQDIANQNKVTASARVGYVKVDKEGHKWFSATEDGAYHRRQSGDVYVAEWDGKNVRPITLKVQAKAQEFLQDTNIKTLSNHLGVSKSVSNEHESEIFKNGVFLQKEIQRNIHNQDINLDNRFPSDKAIFDNPKMQKRLQKMGNVMSTYGMLQTASFLFKAEKCETTNYTTKEACEARKHIAIISLTQEATELVSGTVSKVVRGNVPKVKTVPKPIKVGTSSLKSFGKSLIRNPLKGLPVLGLGLDGASLGLDIFDLTKAQTPTEKGIAGTNVALSSLSLIASTTALASSLLGFTAVAAFAGPAAIVVGVLSFAFNIGVTIWQTIEYEKEHIPHVRQAAKYFETMHSLYDQQWYVCKDSTLYFRPGIAIKSLSLTSYYIEANSEYMCETKRNNYKTHVKVYPLLLGSIICDDYDTIESNCYCHDLSCSGLINVRSGLNIPDTQHFACNNLKTVILNTSPITLYDYTYAYFDMYDPVIGLVDRDPSSKFQDTGHKLGRILDSNNYNFDYYYPFCYEKYAIINNIGFKRYIPSITELELGNDPVQIVIPGFENLSFITVSLLGTPGTVYSVYLNGSCKVHIKSKSELYPINSLDKTVWKIFIGIELVDLACELQRNLHVKCSFLSTDIDIKDTGINQVIFIDKHNILSVPLFFDNKVKLVIPEVHALKFRSDRELTHVIDQYLKHNYIQLLMTYTPVKRLRIQACGDEIVSKSFISKLNDYTRLHFTLDFHNHCSEKLHKDSKLHFVKDDFVFYSSSLYSLVWQTHFSNNSLNSMATLPCHSELRNDIFYSVIKEDVYITQTLNLSRNIKVETTYRLSEFRLYLLTISSDYIVPWELLYKLCFLERDPIFTVQEQLWINRSMILTGENDLTFRQYIE